MALSRTKVWVAEVLTFADLNAEFNGILNNALSLISPLTGSLDLDGNSLTLDAAAVTSVVSSAAVSWNFTSGAKSGTPATTGSIANYSAQTFTDSNTAGSGTAAAYVAYAIQRPTLAATNASVTTTNAATLYIPNAPAAGTNETITNAYALWVDDGKVRLDPSSTLVSSASAALDSINITAQTATITGSTNITTATGVNHVSIGIPTYSAASALTVTNAATVYIAGAPAGGGAGPAAITNAYALWVDDGNVRFDGSMASNLLFVDATYDIGASGATRPRDFFLSRNATIGGTLVLSGDAAAALQAVPLRDVAMYIQGLTYGNNVVDATNDIDIAAGVCVDATGAYVLRYAAALTKRSDATFTVGNNGGMLDTGVVGNNDYYLFAIARSDTGVTDYLCSLSSTAPTMPANYDFKRLMGWLRRSAGAILAFNTYETAGGGIEFLWAAPPLDINIANTLTTSRRTDALSVPLNFSVNAFLNVRVGDAAAAAVYISCPDITDQAPSITAAPLTSFRNIAGNNQFWQGAVRTSAAGLIASRSDTATVDSYAVVTIGFQWARRV